MNNNKVDDDNIMGKESNPVCQSSKRLNKTFLLSKVDIPVRAPLPLTETSVIPKGQKGSGEEFSFFGVQFEILLALFC